VCGLRATGRARVYLAERDGLRIALKELSFSLVPSTSELDAFQREAQLLGTLDHPAIPRLLAEAKRLAH
jgi:serine/threonine protein kinase